jgi:outer membrane protein assembly factor BamE
MGAGAMLALAGCKQAPELPSIISPYKIDIQQGNIITQEMLAKLKAGMTRSQVRFALGSPLVIDPFRGDRWDYVSLYQKQGKEAERRRITVIFEEDRLVRIEGDVTLTDAAMNPPPAAEKTPVDPAKSAPVKKPEVEAPAVTKAEPAKPVAAVPEKAEQPVVAPKPAAASPETTKPAGAMEAPVPDANKAATANANVDEKKADPAKKDAPKEKPKSGFFGRMLDKLGI